MVLNNEVIQSEKRDQFIYNNTTKDVETRYIARIVKATLDTKREFISGSYSTIPFGYTQS